MAKLLRALDQACAADPARPDPRLSDRLDMYADATDARCAKLRTQLAAGEDLARMLRDQAHPSRQHRSRK